VHSGCSLTSDFVRHQVIVVPKKVIFSALAVILFLFLTFSGLLNRGYESKTISFLNVLLTSEGRGFGSKRMLIRKGQTLTANYEVQVERGELYIYLQKLWAAPNIPATGQVRLKQSVKGQFRVPIPETGVYKLWIRGLPDAVGYHLSYTVSWKTE
jgi:hypothetical protein